MSQVEPLRILSIYDCVFPDRHGGVEHRNRKLGEALSARGHHVTLAGWMKNDVPGGTAVDVVKLAGRTELYGPDGKRRPQAAFAFARAVAGLDISRYDVVETANIPYAHILPLAVKARTAGVPLVITWHEYWGNYWSDYIGPLKGPMFAVFETLCAQLGEGALSVSRFTGRRVNRRRLFGQDVQLVPNGIPLDAIRGSMEDRTEDSAPPLVFAGRLHANKRVDLLLRAVGRLKARSDTPLLRVIGEGPEEATLHALARRLGVERQVEFTGRLADIRDVWRMIAGAKLAVQPSAREGFGMFPLESLAVGVPVLYCESDQSAVGEVVRDGIEGRRVASTPSAIARCIEELLDNESQRDQLSRAARRRARDFDWDSVARCWERAVAGIV